VKPWTLLAVALGGALGTLARVGADSAAADVAQGAQLSTLVVNVMGALALGFITGHGLPRLKGALHEGITIGVLGSYTTMSGVSVIVVSLPSIGVAYVLITLALGLALAWAGYLLGTRIPGSDHHEVRS
jgi:CrcB protein